MKIKRSDLDWAVTQNILNPQQADALWTGLCARTEPDAKFSVTHVLYYLGALIIIGAMSWFITDAWDRLHSSVLLIVSGGYLLGFLLVGNLMWFKSQHRIPAGLFITISICLTPLFIYSLQRALHLWPHQDPGDYHSFFSWVNGGWFAMELVTLISGLIALRLYKFPFMSAPVALVLWFMSMDLTPILFQGEGSIYEQRKWMSLVFGLIMIAGSYMIDRNTKEDVTFWGYLFGCIAFWGGLTLLDGDSELSRFAHFAINVGLIALSLFLDRKVFLVFGVFGVVIYLYHLSSHLFEDSLTFSIALSAQGLLLVYLGILYSKHHEKIERRVTPYVQKWRPRKTMP